jgi:hypothetical protein
MRPGHRDAQAAAHAGEALDVIERLAALHLEAVDHVKLFEVVRPCAQGGREGVAVAKIEADDPPGP